MVHQFLFQRSKLKYIISFSRLSVDLARPAATWEMMMIYELLMSEFSGNSTPVHPSIRQKSPQLYIFNLLNLSSSSGAILQLGLVLNIDET